MVATRRSSSVPKRMEKTRVFSNNNQETGKESDGADDAVAMAESYEEMRALRMQENMERLKKLGILELSKNLKKPTSANVSPKTKKMKKPDANAEFAPSRRSSRLKDMIPVSYVEKYPKVEKIKRMKKISIGIGSNPEVYTEEHEKLLGDSKTPWILYVDGYDESGQRIYDPTEGKSCHQCRQKTLGRRTKCSKCKTVGLCGDCLYMRYGENVIEVNENPDWICPVCRDICNCSRCRRSKGWAATGAIYPQVHARGFKSVAHYLVKAYRSDNKTGDEGSEIPSLELLAASSEKPNEANVDASGDHEDEDDELFVLDDDHVADSEMDD